MSRNESDPDPMVFLFLFIGLTAKVVDPRKLGLDYSG
jgi:hypothetical protein